MSSEKNAVFVLSFKKKKSGSMQPNIFGSLYIRQAGCVQLFSLNYTITGLSPSTIADLNSTGEVARFAYVALEILKFQKHNVNSSCRKCSKKSSPFK